MPLGDESGVNEDLEEAVRLLKLMQSKMMYQEPDLAAFLLRVKAMRESTGRSDWSPTERISKAEEAGRSTAADITEMVHLIYKNNEAANFWRGLMDVLNANTRERKPGVSPDQRQPQERVIFMHPGSFSRLLEMAKEQKRLEEGRIVAVSKRSLRDILNCIMALPFSCFDSDAWVIRMAIVDRISRWLKEGDEFNASDSFPRDNDCCNIGEDEE